MAWPLTDANRELFIQVLEPNPPTRGNNIKIRYCSFYSSELKSLGQLLRTLLSLSNGNHQSDERTDVRYRNTLFTTGLIKDAGGEPRFILSNVGRAVLNYCEENTIAIGTFADAANRPQALAIEFLIMRNLVSELIQGDPSEVCDETFKKLLFNGQELYYSIPEDERVATIGSDVDCYFFQLINSTRYEVKRFFRLPNPLRQSMKTLWFENSERAGFPAAEPAGLIDSAIFKYCRTRAATTLQYDIRFRVQAFLSAYHNCVLVFGADMPYLNDNLENLNIRPRIAVTSMRTFTLEERAVPAAVTKPRQRIICGCPGSGKSFYIEDQAIALPNYHLIKTSFHQESTYFDFVGSYKPTPLYEANENIRNSAGEIFSLGKPVINYSFVSGPLTEAILYAVKNPNRSIALVIDEINRGNVGVIFGDFLQLLDRDSGSHESRYSILPHADLALFLNGFDFMKARLEGTNGLLKLPGNLFIWGTMNSADQGVFPLDSAFRRRWEFEYKGYNEPCSYATDVLRYNNADVQWDVFRKKINEQLLSQLAIQEDKLIGPYFLTKLEIADPEKVLNKLFLYMWEDVIRFQHKELMNFNSFADLKQAWNGGQGKIFTFDIP